MSKLNVLYNVIKTMKDLEKVEGTADVEAKFDEQVFGTLEGAFKKDKASGQCEKRVKVKVGNEEFKFEHEGSMKMQGNMCKEGHHHHGFMRHAHGMHGSCDHGPKAKMGKFMMLLKALDKMQLQELDDNRKLLSIQFEGDEIPQEVMKMMHHKMHMQHGEGHGCCGHHGKMKELMSHCPAKNIDHETIALQKIEVQVFINDQYQILSKTASLAVNALDTEGVAHTMSVQFNMELK